MQIYDNRDLVQSQALSDPTLHSEEVYFHCCSFQLLQEAKTQFSYNKILTKPMARRPLMEWFTECSNVVMAGLLLNHLVNDLSEDTKIDYTLSISKYPTGSMIDEDGSGVLLNGASPLDIETIMVNQGNLITKVNPVLCY